MKRSAFKPRKWNKFRAVKTYVDGIKFDSMLEAGRYEQLRLLEMSGDIKDLEIQKQFSLSVNGRQVCVIIPDFVYWEKDEFVIEDAKGVITDVFRIKWKLMQILYPNFEYRIYQKKKRRAA